MYDSFRLPGVTTETTPLERTIANRGMDLPLTSLKCRRRFADAINSFLAYLKRDSLDPRTQPFRDVPHRCELPLYVTVRPRAERHEEVNALSQ